MEVRFRTRTLRICYEQSQKGVRAWGAEVARKYILRVKILKVSTSLSDLMAQSSLRCHALKGDRVGQYAMKLTGRWRLVFSFTNDATEIVCIEEVSNHYDD